MMATTKITVSPPSAGGSYGGRNEKASLDQDRAGGGGNEAGTKSASPEETSHKKEKLMVALRIRPLKYEEKARGNKCVAEKVDDRMILLLDGSSGKRSQGPPRNTLGKNRSNERQYVFDMTFGADSTQQEVYEKTTQPLVKSVLEGFHATVFAYGATGAGKTFTMVGTPEHPGCMARALNELFETMEQTAAEFVFKVTMSYLEIYNENIRDLLNPSSGHLELRDDSRGKNITVAGLSEYAAKNTEEVMKLLQKGNKERTQEPTAANKTSSRSHALLMVNVKQTAKSRAQTRGAVKFGRLYMIDLAGSERASQTENRGKRLKEGAHINRSLLALGNVINALAEHKARGHVNFRDSKLTRLLKEALSGNCYTVMIAHISPADKHREESRNTLVYADRAKNISSKVRKNVLDVSYHISQYQTIISDLRGEIGRLKEKMVFEQNTGGQPGAGSGTKKAELQELREHMVVNFKDQMSLRQRLMEIDNHILGLSMEFERQNIIINEYETEKAKHIHDRNWRKRRSQSAKKSANRPKSGGQQQPQKEEGADTREDEDKDEEEEEAYEGDKEESGFEDNGSATNNSDDEEDQLDQGKSTSKEEDDPEPEPDDKETRSIADISKDSDDDEDAEEEEEPEEVKQAWDELLLVQREQQRYSDIKYDLEQDLERCKKKQNKLEDELPKRISTEEEAEILQLLCKVHELEIAKVEMQRDAILKEHEVRKRDLLILKYDKQRTLCDEIIDRQRELIEALESNKANGKSGDVGGGQALPMPPELMELYNLYKQELETRSTKENQFVEELDNQIIRAPSMISLRGGPTSLNHLPPIRTEMSTEERLFQSRENLREIDEEYGPQSLGINRTGSQLSLRSPNSSGNEGDDRSSLPPINGSSAASRHSSSRLSRSAEAASRQPSRYRNSGRSGIPVPVSRRKKSLPPSRDRSYERSPPTSPRRPFRAPSHAPSRGPSRSRNLTRSTSETPPTRLPPISKF